MTIPLDHWADWFMPVILSAVAYYLRMVAAEIRQIGVNLAVTVQRVDDHDKRLDRIEETVICKSS